MKTRSILLILLLALLFAGCMPEENLPMGNTETIEGYFIESYCRPDLPFAMTVTRVLPLTEHLTPHFCEGLDATITAQYPVELRDTIYFHSWSAFPYNYISREIFNARGVDTLYLEIRTAENKLIRATTRVPSEVKIDTAFLQGSQMTICFETSADPDENFYLYTVQTLQDETTLSRNVSFVDFSSYPGMRTIERSLACPEDEEIPTHILVSLKRFTKDCYDYQLSLNEANSTQQGSITTPIPLAGNIDGALGIFTCFREDILLFDLQYPDHPVRIRNWGGRIIKGS